MDHKTKKIESNTYKTVLYLEFVFLPLFVECSLF